MTSFEETIVLTTTPGATWERVGGFAGFANILPPGALKVEGAGAGAVRRVPLPDGGVVVERCTAERDRAYDYVVLESPLPFTNYRATYAVESHPEGALIRWSGSFDLNEGVPEQAFLAELGKSLQGLLQRAKAVAEARA